MSTPNFSDASTNYANLIANLNFTFNAGTVPIPVLFGSNTLNGFITNEVYKIMQNLYENTVNNNLNPNASNAFNLNSVIQAIKNQVIVNGAPNSQDPTPLTALLEVEFARALNIPVNPADFSTGSTFTPPTVPTNLGDLQDLYEGLVNGQPPLTQTPAQFISTLFTNAFNYFITSDLASQNFPATFSSSASMGSWFANNWSTFLTSISTTSASTPTTMPGLNTTGGIPQPFGSVGQYVAPALAQSVNIPNINSYSQIFFAFNPDATQADFQSFLADFYNQQVEKNGYFIPSQSLGDFFVATVQQSKISADTLGSLEGNSPNSTAIIFRVFALLTSMTAILQNVASTQAEVLNFYGDLEKAYTNLTSKLPNIGSGNVIQDSGGHYGSGDTNNSEVTQGQQMISTQNQSWGTQLRDFRSVIQSQAQQQQTAVDQSNQAVNQQASLATTLLQQMSTILTAIYTTASA